MPDARTALIRGIATTMLAVVVSCARADATPAKVGQVQVKQVQVEQAQVKQESAIGCRIRVTAEGEALRIEAVATSREEASGNYQLDISKSSASGSSHNIQSGDFSLEAGREKILSTTFLGAADAGHFQAKLVIDSNSGSVSCVSP
jgi:hypothetical protein